MIKKVLIIVGLLLTTLVALDVFNKPDLKVIDTLERLAYDLRVRLSAKDELDTRVVIIDIDEKSLLAEGQFPWPRAKIAKMVDQLFDQYLIDTLGFDVLFAEPENSFTLEQINSVASLDELAQISGDQMLANSFQGRSVVLGMVFEDFANQYGVVAESVGVLPTPIFADSDIAQAVLLAETDAATALRYSANISVLQQSAERAGFFSILSQDSDGSIRRIGVLNKHQGQLYSSLALQLLKAFFFDEPKPILVDTHADGYFGLEGIEMLTGNIPLDENARVYVPYSVPGSAYAYISATDILSGAYEGDITGAIAIVGTSAAGLLDIRSTPVSPTLPGVEVHANVVSAMLDGNFRVKPAWVSAADLLVVIVVGLLLSIALAHMSALKGAVLFILVSAGVICGNWYFWTEKLMILSIAPALSLATAIYFMNVVVGFFSESRARKISQKMFGLYVPPEVVDKMSGDANIYSLKSEKREMTVLFTDIRNFTTISESMTPEVLSEWINEYLTPMTRIIHKHDGAIDKYIGDAIMAFWGAPMADENHASNAVKASLEMLAYLDNTINKEFAAKGWPTISIGVGLNTGAMSVGNMGSEFRMSYTVLGDAVNLGARLEGLTKEYGVPLVVSEFTKAAAPDFNYTELDTVKVKGKNKAVTIYACEQPSEA